MVAKANKVAIVSGGATLIGVAIARALRDDGASVVLADINEAAGSKAAAELGSQVSFFRTDITVDADIDACIDHALGAYGGLHCLVNVACTYLDNGLASTRKEWMTALNVNVVSAAIFSAKAAPHMKARGGGAIVNFGSISGKVAQCNRMLYSTSKAAIMGMTRTLAMQLAAEGIRVNAISPGWTWSNVIRDLSGDNRERADRVAAPLHMLGRLVDPMEVGRTAAFLCSEAASGITGADIAVDGGYSALGPEQRSDLVSALAGS